MIKQLNSFFVIFIGVLLLQSCSNDDATAPVIDKSGNLLALGDSANEILSAAEFNSMVIEVVSVQGFELNSASMANFLQFVGARVNKPGGIRVVERSIAAPQNTAYTIQQVADVESEHRTEYNLGDEIALFVFVADQDIDSGSSGEVTLGAAYRNTSIVLFGPTIRDIDTNNNGVNRTTIETAALEHELGHVLGLVNLGTPMQTEHQDEPNGNHCDVSNCLMNFEIGFASSFINVMEQGTFPGLDAQCIADLQANGGK